MLKAFGVSLLWVYVFFTVLIYDRHYVPDPPEPTFGLTEAETIARVAELRARDKPYKPDAPELGERGYGVVQTPAMAQNDGRGASGPLEVTPVYYCRYWSFANPYGYTFKSYYPCESPREHYRTFPNGYGWQ